MQHARILYEKKNAYLVEKSFEIFTNFYYCDSWKWRINFWFFENEKKRQNFLAIIKRHYLVSLSSITPHPIREKDQQI